MTFEERLTFLTDDELRVYRKAAKDFARVVEEEFKFRTGPSRVIAATAIDRDLKKAKQNASTTP